MPFSLSATEIQAWLRLALEPGLPPRTALTLLQQAGTPEQIYLLDTRTLCRWLPDSLARQMSAPPLPALAQMLMRTTAWLAEPGHHLLPLHHPAYPPLLLSIADPPLLLFLAGRPDALQRPAIAIVGARNATPAGMRNAHAFAHDLAQSGWLIISGMARGIDAAAHAGALAGTQPGQAATLAVLGCGPDIVYPAAHTQLAADITQRGALLTDYAPGTPPLPGHFPRRNRLVAALSQGTLVIEAAPRSGSLITARLAAEFGREVFALPGPIHAPLARGCHALIRQGAKLVETIADITEELPAVSSASQPRTASPKAVPSPALPSTAKQLLDYLDETPITLDELLRYSGLDVATVRAALWDLELAGLLACPDGGRFQRLR